MNNPFEKFYKEWCHGSTLSFKVLLNIKDNEEFEALKNGKAAFSEMNCARKKWVDLLQETTITTNKEEALEKAIYLLKKKLDDINMISGEDSMYKPKDEK